MIRIVALLVLAAAAAVLFWWWWQPAPVSVATATRGPAAEIVYATGVVEPERWARITALRRGRIVESCRCEGRTLAKGEVLFRLDDTETRAQLEEVRARLLLAEKELVRAVDLMNRGVSTRERYDQAVAAVASLRAARAVAESQLVDLEIRAPIAGMVLRIEGEVGEIAELALPLAWIGEPAPLIVVADVNEEDIPRVVPGQGALLKADAFPGALLSARVDTITPMGDPVLKTYRVRLRPGAGSPLRIGMSVDVNIVVREVAGAVLVPAAALDRDRVQIVLPDGRLGIVPVTVGLRGAERVEIVAGLAEGTEVVSPWRGDLTPGARVRVIRAAP